MKSVVSTKGQVTLPATVRAKLGLAAGTPVQFELRDGGVLLRKGGGDLHPVDRVFGRLSLGKPVDTLLDEMRGPRPEIPRPSRGRRVSRRR
jgi:AbrB family looped-hinge helix DNA binding protein